jgi:hypothetical protein
MSKTRAEDFEFSGSETRVRTGGLCGAKMRREYAVWVSVCVLR